MRSARSRMALRLLSAPHSARPPAHRRLAGHIGSTHQGAIVLSLIAYIDPGSGSLIIQAVIATALAVPFFLREQIARLVRGLRRGKPDDRAS